MFYELEYAVTNRFDRDELTAVSKQLLNDGVTIEKSTDFFLIRNE